MRSRVHRGYLAFGGGIPQRDSVQRAGLSLFGIRSDSGRIRPLPYEVRRELGLPGGFPEPGDLYLNGVGVTPCGSTQLRRTVDAVEITITLGTPEVAAIVGAVSAGIGRRRFRPGAGVSGSLPSSASSASRTRSPSGSTSRQEDGAAPQEVFRQGGKRPNLQSKRAER